MNHRLFISIDIPKNIKSEIEAIIQDFQSPFFRFVAKENWHITVLFLGDIKDEEMPILCEELNKAAADRDPFEISFDRIIYGPNDKNPRMIWLVASFSKEFQNLRDDIRRRLSGKINFSEDNKSSIIHITLARKNSGIFNEDRFGSGRDMSPDNESGQHVLPPLNFKFSSRFDALKINLMESHLQKRGPEYYLLEEWPLG